MKLSNRYPIFATILCVFLSACSSTSRTASDIRYHELLHDEYFPASDSVEIESQDAIFALSPEAKSFVNNVVLPRKSQKEQVHALVSAIFDHSSFDLLYSAEANNTASQTFSERAANCLSLTIMTYAMSKHVGLNSSFQKILIPEFWTLREGVTILNGHVNLRVKPESRFGKTVWGQSDLVIDFDPQQDTDLFAAKELSKAQISAMFYNNKAAEYILQRNYDFAYAYLKRALEYDPYFKDAMLNLGFIYRKIDALEEAEQAYLAAIAVDEDYLTAWDNLSTLYKHTDRLEQAQQIEQRLVRIRENNPYYHFMLAEIAYNRGQYASSAKHYKNAIKLDNKLHQFYFGLAQAYFQMNELDLAKRNLTLAKRKSGNSEHTERYERKIDMLSQLSARNHSN
uniref:tetratricopeptide repeat protein n=1 Tax=Ningiella ruwaisensis TaxID=2364274 RepID=UPI00109EEC87|nr:tetratricopeptide repeat protein [Ningiella ruwaisensis]